jgi:hypothetical protein
LEKDSALKGVHDAFHTVAEMRNLVDMLDTFRATPRFDMYNQSPWAAGPTMSAIISNAQALGLSNLVRKGLFGSFLHMYNMLQQMGAIEKVEVLEDLCKLFTQEVFVGQRPKSNFASILSRFKGATPTHFKGGGGHTSMIFTPHENNMDTHIKVEERIYPRTTSLFVSQFLTDYRFDTHTVDVLISKMNLRIPRDAPDRTKILALFGHHEKYIKSVTQLRKLLLEEFTGRLPSPS